LAQQEWKKRYERAVDRNLESYFRIGVATAFPEIFIKFMFFMLIAVSGLIFSQRPHQEVLSLLPMLGTFVIVVNRFLPSIYILGSTFMIVAEGLPGINIVYDLCNQRFAEEAQGGKILEAFNDQITFDHVSFKYVEPGDDLLKDVCFSIPKRKMTAIVGLSGAGKTTIINLLLKLYRPNAGAIKIDGIDIREYNNQSYLSRIGYVSQETFVFNNTIRENIRFGMDNCTDEMIVEAARLANAHDFVMETPQGYATVVGDGGMKLSGGQRQRIAIARAMLRRPEIIIFDEATSSLDNISEKKIQKAIQAISRHTTVLVVAHRLSTVQQAEKIIILEKGQIKEQGVHEELLANKSLYYALHMSNMTETSTETEKE
jgi:ABC-type multidrug transport system fused ATPase/permease subunit